MLEWLKAILGESYTEEIDKKVSSEVGKGFVSKTDFNAVNEEKKALEKTLSRRDTQLEELKKSAGDNEALKAQIAELQEKNTADAAAHAEEIGRLKLEAAVDAALMNAGARNTKAVRALIDMTKVRLCKDGSAEGMDEQLSALKKGEDTEFLFEHKTAGYKGMKPREKSLDVGTDMSLKELRAMSAKERYKFSVEHPEDYKAIYEKG